MSTRLCKTCKSPSHMTKVVDAKFKVYDTRYRVCFQCQPDLDSEPCEDERFAPAYYSDCNSDEVA